MFLSEFFQQQLMGTHMLGVEFTIVEIIDDFKELLSIQQPGLEELICDEIRMR